MKFLLFYPLPMPLVYVGLVISYCVAGLLEVLP